MSNCNVTVTDQDFEQQVLRSDLPVMVDFWAEWCGSCHMLAPVGAGSTAAVDLEREAKLLVLRCHVKSSRGASPWPSEDPPQSSPKSAQNTANGPCPF